MPANNIRPILLDAVTTLTAQSPADWLWHGYLMPGEVTLLTSFWKTGKTTLLCGLLRHLGSGEPFLDRPVRPARVWVLSEESVELWADRVRTRPFGPHVQLLARPFRRRPTPDDWRQLIDSAADARAAGELDLFVVDPLASFLPGRCESDAATLLEALQPLHRLTCAGCAVLLLHHPRKKAAEAGSMARGSGALPGFADVTIELTRYSRYKSDAARRLLFAQSRRPETPTRLAYEWDAATAAFRAVAGPRERQFEENWQTVLAVLTDTGSTLTAGEIRQHWPEEAERPGESTLYNWLNHAHTKGLIQRIGRGTKSDPWRYRIETQADRDMDRYDRDNPLPPVRGIFD